METVIALQIDEVDLDDADTLDAIEAYLDEALWSQIDGAVTAEITVPRRSAVEDTVEFVRKINCRLAGAVVKRVRRDLVSASDIAHRTGFSREAVRKWSHSPRQFPAPFDTVGGTRHGTRVWLWPDVAEWLHVTYHYPIDRDWPSDATIAAIEAALNRIVDDTSQEWQTLQYDSGIPSPASSPRVTVRSVPIKAVAASETLAALFGEPHATSVSRVETHRA